MWISPRVREGVIEGSTSPVGMRKVDDSERCRKPTGIGVKLGKAQDADAGGGWEGDVSVCGHFRLVFFR